MGVGVDKGCLGELSRLELQCSVELFNLHLKGTVVVS